MIRIPPDHFVVRQNRAQKEYIKQQFPDKPLPHTILVTRVPGNSSSIRGDPELSKPRSRSLRKYASDKPDTSRKTALSVMRTSRKERTSGKDKGKSKGKSKKRPSDKGDTRKDKKAKARKKQGKKKRRKTKRRSSKII